MLDLIQLAIPAFILLLVTEAIVDAWMRRDLYEPKDTAASLSMGVGNVVVGLVSKGLVFAIFLGVHKFAIFLLLVSPHQSRMPLLLGFARGTPLFAALQFVDCASPDLDRRLLLVRLLALDAPHRF